MLDKSKSKNVANNWRNRAETPETIRQDPPPQKKTNKKSFLFIEVEKLWWWRWEVTKCSRNRRNKNWMKRINDDEHEARASRSLFRWDASDAATPRRVKRRFNTLSSSLSLKWRQFSVSGGSSVSCRASPLKPPLTESVSLRHHRVFFCASCSRCDAFVFVQTAHRRPAWSCLNDAAGGKTSDAEDTKSTRCEHLRWRKEPKPPPGSMVHDSSDDQQRQVCTKWCQIYFNNKKNIETRSFLTMTSAESQLTSDK